MTFLQPFAIAKKQKTMHYNSKYSLSLLISIAVIAVWSAPALALVDHYTCTYESETDFGDSIEFGYDLNRNSILLQKHHAGDGYRPDFTLGNVSQTDQNLKFQFEFWENGMVAMRESLSLNLRTMIIDAAQQFYNPEGVSIRDGQTAIGGCSKKSVTAKSQTTTIAIAPQAKTDVAPPIQGDKATKTDIGIACYTKEFAAEGPKSATYCVRSQLPAQKEYSYGPENLAQADGAWCEGETGQGIGVGVVKWS